MQRRATALLTLALIGAGAALPALAGPNADIFLRSLPQDEQRELMQKPSFLDRFKSPGKPTEEEENIPAARDERLGEMPKRSKDSPEEFLENYMQCDYIRAGYNRADPCTKPRTSYCKWLRELPTDVRTNIATEFQCYGEKDEDKRDPALRDPTFDDGDGRTPVQSTCDKVNAGTLKLLRKHFGKESETQALLFFSRGLARELSNCTKGKKGG